MTKCLWALCEPASSWWRKYLCLILPPMYCFSCWHHEIWQYFWCWFANNIHLVFSWCLSVQEIRILCHQKEEISISKSKITIASLGFLVDSWRKLCKSCEKSQQDELLLQAPTCPCWQSVLVPFTTPQLWAVVVVLKVFIGQSLSDHNSAVMK